jgi:hypothetical protein
MICIDDRVTSYYGKCHRKEMVNDANDFGSDGKV